MTVRLDSFDVEQEALSAAGRELGSALGAVVVLAGQVRTTRFSEGLGVARLELPVRQGATLLDLWISALAEWKSQIGGDWPVRIQMHRDGQLPDFSRSDSSFRISHDPVSYRGTAGVLADVTEDLAPDQSVLVVAGPCIPTQSPGRVVSALAQEKADVALVNQPDGLPAGLILVKRSVLNGVPKVGFWDFKERLLSRADSAGCRIQVVDFEEPVTLPVRTMAEYLQALRRSMVKPGKPSVRSAAFEENLSGTFRLVDPSASVEEGVRILDSVVLAGARIGAGALVVRSVIGAGAVVKPREQVVDTLVAAPRKGDDRP